MFVAQFNKVLTYSVGLKMYAFEWVTNIHTNACTRAQTHAPPNA